MEFQCIPFAEDILYGHLRKKPINSSKGDSR